MARFLYGGVRAAGSLLGYSSAPNVGLKDHRGDFMGKLIARIKVLPTDTDINLDGLVDRIKSSLPDGMQVRNSAKEPIAFGLNALIVDFLLEDKEGQMDKLESVVKDTEGVSEIEIMNLGRQVGG